MKNTLKLFGIIAITAVIVFSMAACIINVPDDPGNLIGGVPDAPTGLTATATSSTDIVISWNAVSGALGYNVYISLSASSGFQLMKTTTDTYTSGYNASPGTTYYITVTAYNGKGEGPRSNIVSATTLSSGGGALPAPTGLTATATSTSTITLTWNAVSGASSYNVYQSQNGYQFDKLGTVTTPGATNNNLSPNTTLYYQVAAVAANGTEGARSNTVSATTLSSGGGNVPVQSVSLNSSSISLTVNQSTPLTATIQPSNATNKNVNWTSSNNSVASVSNGTVTGVSAGTATITVTTVDGGKTATCTVNVTGGGNVGSGTETNPIALYNNQWTDGEITVANNRTQWFSFSVTAGSTYHVWWNDRNNGSGAYSVDVKVSAFYSDGREIFKDIDVGWGGTSGKSFMPTSTGTVKLKVFPYSSSSTGSFAIVYSSTNFNSMPALPGAAAGSSEDNAILLTAGVWKIGNIANGDVWYSINVTNGSMYYVWWDDRYQGSNSYSADVSVMAWFSDGSVAITNTDSGYNTSKSFLATSNDPIKVRVRSSGSGTYAITYATSNTRP